MSLKFEWNSEKAASNQRKHGVSFVEASTAFGDPLSVTIADPRRSDDKARWILLGQTFQGKLIVVVHVERGDGIRIVSAREATRRERREYEQA